MERKKVGIITLHGYFNYGNKLQNYAVTRVMKNLGFEPATVVIRESQTAQTGIGDKLKNNSPSEILKRVKNKLKEKVSNAQNSEAIEGRRRKFKAFSDEYLNEKFYGDSKEELEELSKEYDYFITGSDQVWNPFYINNSENYFLKFADRKKRVAFSPSFGIEEIPDQFRDDYIERLSEMHRISVRESAGADIVRNLTGREATVLIDPTLMLTKEEWLEMSKPSPYKPKEKYLLTYFLGDIPKTYSDFIEKTARDHDLKIVNMADIGDPKSYMEDGPSEFVDYINSASIFMTDSFHGVVFATLMQTPFCVFRRVGASIYSRIETLLNMFDLKNREFETLKDKENVLEVDYSHVGRLLGEQRKRADDYLREALDIED